MSPTWSFNKLKLIYLLLVIASLHISS